jgi:hypothetical protein
VAEQSETVSLFKCGVRSAELKKMPVVIEDLEQLVSWEFRNLGVDESVSGSRGRSPHRRNFFILGRFFGKFAFQEPCQEEVANKNLP